jgi:hypothetical protein
MDTDSDSNFAVKVLLTKLHDLMVERRMWSHQSNMVDQVVFVMMDNEIASINGAILILCRELNIQLTFDSKMNDYEL